MYRITLILLFLAIFTGCATTRTNQFIEFAEAGKVYADAINTVTEEAGEAAIDVDSTILIRVRENLENQDRIDTIVEHNNILKERLRLLRNIRQHGRILKRYFSALSKVSQSKSPEKIMTVTEDLVNSLGTISDDIKNAKIGNMAVNEFTGPATNILVAHIKLKLLETELKKHAAIIERELDLQEAAFKLILSQMKTDLEAIFLSNESTEIIKTYISDKKLPSNWSRRRKEILTATITLDAVNAASRAANHLKKAYIALVENKFDITHLDALINDIEEIYTLIDTIVTEEEKTSEED